MKNHGIGVGVGVHLGIGPPFGTLDQILSCSSFSSDNYCILILKAPSLTRKRVSSYIYIYSSCVAYVNAVLVNLNYSKYHLQK
jgi:hypothetical protein